MGNIFIVWALIRIYIAITLVYGITTLTLIIKRRYLNSLYIFSWKIPNMEAELHCHYAAGLTWTNSKRYETKREEAIAIFRKKYPTAKLFATTYTLQHWYAKKGIQGVDLIRSKSEERKRRLSSAYSVITNVRNLFIIKKGGWKTWFLCKRIWSTTSKKYYIIGQQRRTSSASF